VASLCAIAALAAVRVRGGGVLAEIAFAAFVVAWAVISVGGTALAAQRSPAGEGEGIGVYNAASAAAGVVGAILGGWTAARWNYPAVAAVGAACIAAAVALGAVASRRRAQSPAASR